MHSVPEDEIIDAALTAFYEPNGEPPWHPVAVASMRRALTAVAALVDDGEYPLVRFCRCKECQSNPDPGKMTAHDVVIERGAFERNIAQFRTTAAPRSLGGA